MVVCLPLTVVVLVVHSVDSAAAVVVVAPADSKLAVSEFDSLP